MDMDVWCRCFAEAVSPVDVHSLEQPGCGVLVDRGIYG